MVEEKCYDLTNAEIKKANQEHPIFTTRADLKEALTRLGVHAGMKMIVHSSFSSLGKVEGGPETLCTLLQELLTEEGTLILPTLTRYPASGEAITFDPAITPSRVGILTEYFRKMPGVVRSWDPTHSFSVWGKDKVEYVKNHHLLPTMHPKSPLGLLEAADGYALMIGCWTEVTFMHVVETSCGAGCLGARTEEYDAVLNGKKVRLRGWGWRGGHCETLNHKAIYDFMRDKHTVSEMMLGRSHLALFRLRDYRTAYEHLLLDPNGGCAHCSIRPRQVQQCLPSDWDAEHDCLLPSNAYRGDWEPLK